MRILLIGSGGREHALAWKIAQSPLLTKLYAVPGNPGIADHAELVALDVNDPEAVVRFARSEAIDLVVVGPEQPLVNGVADALRDAAIPCFGPSAAAARLEGSKGFTKDLCHANRIPTAAYGRFDNVADALDYLADQNLPIVIKADGLAAGKGVVIAETRGEAEAAVRDMLGGRFGSAGAELVIEEFLVGEEASFFALCDGKTAIPLSTAQDHKRVGEGDTGPNTGGMGAYSPAPVMTPALVDATMRFIIEPTLAAMAEMGAPFVGILYAGLMITEGGPKLIEYNVRFGDPECQVLMMRLQSDLLPLLRDAADGALDPATRLDWSPEAAVTVVLAANGYPGTLETGTEISGLEKVSGAKVFQAGTKLDRDRLLASGGRVLNVTAMAPSVSQAVERAYRAVDQIHWPHGFCRRDIGWRAIEREREQAAKG